MLNLKRITTTAAAALCVALPAGAAASPADPRSPVAATQSYVDLRSPDTRDAARSAEAVGRVDLRSPDARDVGRTIVQPPEPVQIVELPVGGGFQWGDAGIGAAGMLALVLLVASLGMVAGQRRRIGRSTVASR